MARKLRIILNVTNNGQSSSCPLIIEGIIPKQKIDLCSGRYTNLMLLNTVDSRSTPPNNPGPVPAVGEFFIS